MCVVKLKWFKILRSFCFVYECFDFKFLMRKNRCFIFFKGMCVFILDEFNIIFKYFIFLYGFFVFFFDIGIFNLLNIIVSIVMFWNFLLFVGLIVKKLFNKCNICLIW